MMLSSFDARRSRVRTHSLVGMSLLLTACASGVEPLSVPQHRLTAVTATQLDGAVGTDVSPPPTVLATDADGTPAAGVRLTADVSSGGGSVPGSALVTDGNGRLTIPWTLGTRSGSNSLTLRTAGGEVAFTAIARVGPIAYILIAGGDGQVAAAGTALANPLIARVQDRFGNAVPDATVTFSVVSGTGTIEGETAITDASGVARSGRWTLGPEPGKQEVRIRAGAVETTMAATSYVYVCTDPVPGSCASPLELAFTRRSDNQIYRARSDGSALTRLTNSGRNRSPAWSPDGRRIAFIHSDDAEIASGDVWIMDADGSNQVRRTVAASLASVRWSPDGTRLAVSTDGLYFSRSFVISADGASVPSFEIPQSRRPAWSPDGKRIAVIEPSGDDGYDRIIVMNADGGSRRALTAPGGSIFGRLTWSLDGREVLYTDGGRVIVVPVDGGAGRSLSSLQSVDGVDLSPDGRWLAVTLGSTYGVQREVGYMSISGGPALPIFSDGYEPAWRPCCEVR